MRAQIPIGTLVVALTLGVLDAGSQESPPTFRSSAEVVVLDAIIRDGKGRPVRDLRLDEVQVTEDGEPCEVRSLRAVHRPIAAAAPVPTQTTPAADAAPPAVPAAAAPAAQPSRPPIVVLLFDQLSTDAVRHAAQSAREWLSHDFPAGTLFSVYQLRVGLKRLQPLTADRAAVVTALRDRLSLAGTEREGPEGFEQQVSSADRGQAPSPRGPSQSLTEQAFRKLGQEARNPRMPEPGEIDPGLLYRWDRASRENKGRSSIFALRAVVDALGVVEGRKSVLFFSEGPHTPGEMEMDLLQDTISAANRVNVSVYTVDPSGLGAERPDLDKVAALEAAEEGAVHSGAGMGIPGLMTDIVSAGPQANLRLLASSTGGLATANTDRLAAALARVTDDVSSYYEVVYVPRRSAPDGRFHRTAVKVSRPGLSVRTRSGYIASGSSATVAATEWPLLEALAQPPTAAAAALLPFRTEMLFFGRRGAEREAVVLVEVPLSGVHLAVDEPGKAYRGHLGALVLVKDAAGRPVSRMSHDYPFEGPESERERRQSGQALFRQAVGLAPGRYRLQTVVLDEEVGQSNTSSMDFEVPAGDASLTASSLVLVRRTQTAAIESPTDPLRMGRVDVVPSVGPVRLEPSDDAVGYFVRAYVPAGSEPPSAALEIRQGGEIKAHAAPRLPAPDAEGRIAYLGRVPIDRLATGAYDLELTLRSGTSTATNRGSFEVPERPVPRVESAPASVPAPAPSPLAPKPTDPELVKLLQRAGQYVTDYAEKLRNVVAEEDYRQSYGEFRESDGQPNASLDETDAGSGPTPGGSRKAMSRRTRADLVFVRRPGPLSWASFRDVFEVDGAPVHDRDARLEKLFRPDPGNATDRVRQIAQESARFNLGSATRTLNIPTLPLLFLNPANQARFSYKKVGEGRQSGMATIEVRCQEVARPTLFRDSGTIGDLPVEGRFWIDPIHGIVLRSVIRFTFARDRGDGSVTTQYRYEAGLRLWVPSEMQERYEDRHVAGASEIRGSTTAIARYSNFRQFTVSTEEKAALPPESPEP